MTKMWFYGNSSDKGKLKTAQKNNLFNLADPDQAAKRTQSDSDNAPNTQSVVPRTPRRAASAAARKIKDTLIKKTQEDDKEGGETTGLSAKPSTRGTSKAQTKKQSASNQTSKQSGASLKLNGDAEQPSTVTAKPESSQTSQAPTHQSEQSLRNSSGGSKEVQDSLSNNANGARLENEQQTFDDLVGGAPSQFKHTIPSPTLEESLEAQDRGYENATTLGRSATAATTKTNATTQIMSTTSQDLLSAARGAGRVMAVSPRSFTSANILPSTTSAVPSDKLEMLHSKHVTLDPAGNPRLNRISPQANSISHTTRIYQTGGPVCRFTFSAGKEVDFMLCDIAVCPECSEYIDGGTATLFRGRPVIHSMSVDWSYKTFYGATLPNTAQFPRDSFVTTLSPDSVQFMGRYGLLACQADVCIPGICEHCANRLLPQDQTTTAGLNSFIQDIPTIQNNFGSSGAVYPNANDMYGGFNIDSNRLNAPPARSQQSPRPGNTQNRPNTSNAISNYQRQTLTHSGYNKNIGLRGDIDIDSLNRYSTAGAGNFGATGQAAELGSASTDGHLYSDSSRQPYPGPHPVLGSGSSSFMSPTQRQSLARPHLDLSQQLPTGQSTISQTAGHSNYPYQANRAIGGAHAGNGISGRYFLGLQHPSSVNASSAQPLFRQIAMQNSSAAAAHENPPGTDTNAANMLGRLGMNGRDRKRKAGEVVEREGQDRQSGPEFGIDEQQL